MPRNRISSHAYILAKCERLEVEYEDMVKLIKPLLQQYNAGKRDRGNILALVQVQGGKQQIRRRFLEMVRNMDDFTDHDRAVFAYAVACTDWFEEKSNMLLEQMKTKVEDGKEMVYILQCAYLNDEAMTDGVINNELHLSDGTFGRKKKDAIVLYGDLILEYAIRREKEDIEKGLIDPPDFKL